MGYYRGDENICRLENSSMMIRLQRCRDMNTYYVCGASMHPCWWQWRGLLRRRPICVVGIREVSVGDWQTTLLDGGDYNEGVRCSMTDHRVGTDGCRWDNSCCSSSVVISRAASHRAIWLRQHQRFRPHRCSSPQSPLRGFAVETKRRQANVVQDIQCVGSIKVCLHCTGVYLEAGHPHNTHTNIPHDSKRCIVIIVDIFLHIIATMSYIQVIHIGNAYYMPLVWAFNLPAVIAPLPSPSAVFVSVDLEKCDSIPFNLGLCLLWAEFISTDSPLVYKW